MVRSMSMARAGAWRLGLSAGVSVLVLLAQGAPLGAQTAPAHPPATVLPGVEAVAAAPELERLTTAAPETIYRREEFDRLPNDRVSDVVGRMSGVVVGGPPGEKKSLNLRGLPGDFTRVEFDGIQLPSSGQSRTFELMNLPSFVVQDVKILRVPTAEYEADGVAGRVVIDTRGIPDKPMGEARFATGGVNDLDAGNNQGAIAYGGKLNSHFGGFGALNVDRRTITKTKDFSERTYVGGPGGAGFLRDEDEPKTYTNIDFLGNLGGFYDQGEVYLKPLYLDERATLDKVRDQYRRVTGQFIDRTLSTSQEDSTTAGLALDWTHRFGAGIGLEVTLNWARTSFEGANGDRTLGNNLTFSSGSAENSSIKDQLVQGSAKVTLPVDLPGKNFVKLGATVRQSDRKSDRDIFTVNAAGQRSQTADNRADSANSDYKVSDTYAGAFILGQVEVLDGLIATPGFRVELARDELEGGNGGNTSRSFADLLPSISVAYRVTDELTVRAAASRTVNRPKFEEMAPGVTRRGNRTFRGNADLLAAKAWGVEAGMDYATSDVYAGVNLFARKIDNLIEAREISPNVLVYDNVGDGRLRGVEFEQRLNFGITGYSFLRPLTLIANETLIYSRVDDPATGTRPFTEQPGFVSNFTLQWLNPDWGFTAAAVVNYTTQRPIVSYESPAQVRDKTRYHELTLDVQVEQQIVPGLSVYATGENLTNQEREEIEYLNGRLDRNASIATGRVFYVGLKGRF